MWHFGYNHCSHFVALHCIGDISPCRQPSSCSPGLGCFNKSKVKVKISINLEYDSGRHRPAAPLHQAAGAEELSSKVREIFTTFREGIHLVESAHCFKDLTWWFTMRLTHPLHCVLMCESATIWWNNVEMSFTISRNCVDTSKPGLQSICSWLWSFTTKINCLIFSMSTDTRPRLCV